MILTPALVVARRAADTGVASMSLADRRVGLDAARVLGVYAIVWIHAVRSEVLAPTIVLGRFAVPFFVATAVMLVIHGLAEQPSRSLREYGQTRTRRLLLPFAAWTLVYWLLKLLKKTLVPGEPNDFPGWEMILLGSAFHLWFLPFLWAVSLAVFACGRWVMAGGRQEIAAAASWALGIVICLAPAPTAALPWDGLWYMWLALPAACWSFALSLLLLPTSDFRGGAGLRWIALLAWVVATLTLQYDQRAPLAENLAGLSWLLLALTLPPLRCAAAIGRGAPLAYGIYLSHVLFLKVGESVVSRCAWPIGPATDVVLFLVAALASTATIWLLSQRKATRWLLG